MTPKQAAHSLEKYAKRHPDLDFTTFIIPQVPGSIHRSLDIHGVLDSVLETPKYVLPLAILHPVGRRKPDRRLPRRRTLSSRRAH